MKVSPFGNSESSAAARQTAAWADSLLKSVSHTIVDAAKARQLLDRLCAMAQNRISDYDSARQIAWAFRVIYHESTPKENRDRAIDHALSDLEASLALDLPPSKQQVPIERTLQDRLRVVAGFDPAIFQAHFAMIAERLKPGGRTFRRSMRLVVEVMSVSHRQSPVEHRGRWNRTFHPPV